MKHNEYRTLTSYLTFPPVGAMMSVGNFGNPHATCRIAAHSWDRRVLPLSGNVKSARIALPIAAMFSHI